MTVTHLHSHNPRLKACNRMAIYLCRSGTGLRFANGFCCCCLVVFFASTVVRYGRLGCLLDLEQEFSNFLPSGLLFHTECPAEELQHWKSPSVSQRFLLQSICTGASANHLLCLYPEDVPWFIHVFIVYSYTTLNAPNHVWSWKLSKVRPVS